MSDSLTPAAAIRLLVNALNHTAESRRAVRAGVIRAFNNAETPSEDKAARDAAAAMLELFTRLLAAYETTAEAFDAQGGSIVIFGDVPIKSACVRLEGKIASMMSRAWMNVRSQEWLEIAEELENPMELPDV